MHKGYKIQAGEFIKDYVPRGKVIYPAKSIDYSLDLPGGVMHDTSLFGIAKSAHGSGIENKLDFELDAESKKSIESTAWYGSVFVRPLNLKERTLLKMYLFLCKILRLKD